MARETGQAAVARELGALTAEIGRARDDRIETNLKIDKLHDGLDGVAHRLQALEQAAQSTGKLVADIATEKCGVRLDKIEAVMFPERALPLALRLDSVEATVATWRKWMGSGRTFAIRLVLVLIGTSAFWGIMSGIFAKIAARIAGG